MIAVILCFPSSDGRLLSFACAADIRAQSSGFCAIYDPFNSVQRLCTYFVKMRDRRERRSRTAHRTRGYQHAQRPGSPPNWEC